MRDRNLSRFSYPSSMCFSDLRLAREDKGDVSFDREGIERLCIRSGLPADFFWVSHEDALGDFLSIWYRDARSRGEPEDQVEEALVEKPLRSKTVSVAAPDGSLRNGDDHPRSLPGPKSGKGRRATAYHSPAVPFS